MYSGYNYFVLIDPKIIGMSNYLITLSEFSLYAGEMGILVIQEKGFSFCTYIIL